MYTFWILNNYIEPGRLQPYAKTFPRLEFVAVRHGAIWRRKHVSTYGWKTILSNCFGSLTITLTFLPKQK